MDGFDVLSFSVLSGWTEGLGRQNLQWYKLYSATKRWIVSLW
jgi:hypothetical protein